MLTVITQNGLYNAFPGLVRTSTGRRLLVYRKGTGHVGDKGTIVCRIAAGIGLAYSSESTVFSAPSQIDARDPEISEITIGGGAKRLIVSCFVYSGGALANAIRMVWSDNDGDTWQAAVTCTSGFSAWVGCSGKVVQLASGDLLMPCYGSDATDQLIEVLRSTDYGSTWTTIRPFSAVVDGALQEPNIVLLANGSLLMLVRTSGIHTYESVSTDNGVTWSSLVVATTNYGRPHAILLPDGRVGMIERHGNTTRAVVHYRTNGVWSAGSYITSLLPNRMTYASSFIDENGHWEIVVCEEASGSVSNVYGLTIRLKVKYVAIQVGSSALLLNAV